MDDKLKEQVKEKLAAGGAELSDEELDAVAGGVCVGDLPEIRGKDINDWWCPYHKETHKGYRSERQRAKTMPDGRVANIECYICGHDLTPYYLDTQSGQYYDEDMNPIL